MVILRPMHNWAISPQLNRKQPEYYTQKHARTDERPYMVFPAGLTQVALPLPDAVSVCSCGAAMGSGNFTTVLLFVAQCTLVKSVFGQSNSISANL
jgi:hypothetical protein